ncbi:MAG: hemerythrin domain-containing protein [Acidimicrobiia bacterium]|nr:hemerythrin domain-containing protein [Acidimicrobiia bacterium]
MTATIDPAILEAIEAAPVPYDFFREVHKGLRNALFDLTVACGAADFDDPLTCDRIAARVHGLVSLFHSHHGHEDDFIKPLIQAADPRLDAIVDSGHAEIDSDLLEIEAMADGLVAASGPVAVAAGLDLYRRLALFTASYLAHMAFEEGAVMERLRTSLSTAELFEVDMALRGSIPLDKLLAFAAIMLPAMNTEERTAMLGGLRAGAPDEVFEQVRAVAVRCLEPQDYGTIADRLGLVG